MKFLVDELPYYGDLCPFWMNGICGSYDDECPRFWDKYKVCSEDNPHECMWLKEIECDEMSLPKMRT